MASGLYYLENRPEKTFGLCAADASLCAKKPLAVCLILQQLAGETPGFLLLSDTPRRPQFGTTEKTMADLTSDPKGYRDLLELLTTRIRTAQLRASIAVNQELVLLYWGIGKEILTRQREDGWGTKVIERLANDLRRELPDMQGLSPRNLGYMKACAEAWPDEAILQAPLAKLTW